MTETSTNEGLRERKKRQTRATIVAAALRLFGERGFDAVTVAEIARAAEVSEKTVFNHFPTKEDLVFERGMERLAALIDAIRMRPAGASIVAPFRRMTGELVDTIEHGPIEGILSIPRMVGQSRALRERLFIGWEREAAELAPVIAEEVNAPPGDLTPLVVARTLSWTHRVIFRAAIERLPAGEDRVALAADLREQASRAYDLLEGGLAGYGARGTL